MMAMRVAIVLLLAAVVQLQAFREQLPPLPRPEGALMYVSSPAAARRLALSYDALAADLYWIRAIQHYGGTKLSTDPRKTYDQLYPLLDLTTTLDPRFTIAYRFGAIFLSEAYPDGPGRPDLAIELLQKGLRADPRKWEYAQDIGFVNYWWLQRYDEAAAWFLRASESGGPQWLQAMAGVTATQGGSRALARELWRRILAESDLDWMRRNAERRLLQLDALDQIEGLRRQAQAYEERTGQRLVNWQQLVSAGLLRGVPLDPAGHPYLLDSERAAITLAPSSPLNPLP
jgi:tetratricopeptide (TPR) repeat protein